MTTTNTSLSDADADIITRKYTAFTRYSELSDAMERGYVPTVSRRRARPLLTMLRAKLLPVFEIR